jgi:hypothetical protein
MTDQTESIPRAPVVKKRLAAATAQTRYLRRLLKLAKERDEAERLRAEADSAKGGAS